MQPVCDMAETSRDLRQEPPGCINHDNSCFACINLLIWKPCYARHMTIAANPEVEVLLPGFRSRLNEDTKAGDIRLCFSREDDFDFSSDDYSRLFTSSAATAFQHPAWLRHFYEVLAPHRGAAKAVIAFREPDGRLVGVLPMIVRRKAGVRLLETTDLGVSDYAAPALDRAMRDAFARHAELKHRIAPLLPAHDILRIRPIRAEHVEDWQALLEGSVEQLEFGAPFAALGNDYAAWRRTRPSKTLLGRLARAEKQIAKRGGAHLVRLASPAEIRDAVREIQRLRAGRFDGDLIEDDIVRDFYAAVAADPAAGLAEVFRLDIGGAPAGYVYGLGHRGRLCYLLIGCDYAGHGRCSPGLVLYDRIIADWIGRGGDIFDFTIGDEPFKADFGTQRTQMFTLVNAPTWRGKLALAAFRARSRLQAARADKSIGDHT